MTLLRKVLLATNVPPAQARISMSVQPEKAAATAAPPATMTPTRRMTIARRLIKELGPVELAAGAVVGTVVVGTVPAGDGSAGGASGVCGVGGR